MEKFIIWNLRVRNNMYCKYCQFLKLHINHRVLPFKIFLKMELKKVGDKDKFLKLLAKMLNFRTKF